MTRPVVSIVIPCYRQGHLLPEAIDSALGQTFSPVQVVVVNDGSDDDTEQVAARYGDRLTYVHKPNGGLCSARNAGIVAAEGRYLLFLDADDLLDPNAVEWLVERMEDRDDRLCLMGFRFFTSDPYGEAGNDLLPSDGAAWFQKLFTIDPLLVRKPADLQPHSISLLPYLLYTNFGPPHCWLCSRRMVLEVGMFDEDLRSCEDWDLWLRMVALTSVDLSTIPRVGAFYRRYEGSMSTNITPMLDSRVKVLLKASQELRARPELMRQWGAHLLQAARRARRRYAAHGIRSASVEELSREIRILLQFGKSNFSWLGQRLQERTAGARWDGLALFYYRQLRPELFAYYQSDID